MFDNFEEFHLHFSAPVLQFILVTEGQVLVILFLQQMCPSPNTFNLPVKRRCPKFPCPLRPLSDLRPLSQSLCLCLSLFLSIPKIALSLQWSITHRGHQNCNFLICHKYELFDWKAKKVTKR